MNADAINSDLHLGQAGGDVGQTRPRPAWLLWALVLAWFVGAYLRLWQIGQQVVVGDEVHALKSAGAAENVGTILREKGLPDVSIPMALWDYLLIHTIGLSEWGLRLPVLLAGMLAVVLLSVFAWRKISPLAGVLVAWLAAISPQFVMFSRFARPYMAIMSFSLLTVVLWQQKLEGKPYRGWLAILCTLFAIGLSPTCAPALGAANAVGVLLLVKRQGWTAVRPPKILRKGRIVGPASIAVGIAVLGAGLAQVVRLLPEAHNLYLHAKWKGTPVDWSLVLEYIAFTSHRGLRVWFVISLVIGLVNPRPWARVLALTLVAMALTQVATVALFVPWGGRTFSIMRYLLVLYPLALLVIATGVEFQLAQARRLFGIKAPWEILVLLAIVPGIVKTGPLPRLFNQTNSFTGIWPEVVRGPVNAKRSTSPVWPRIYSFLRQSTEELTVMEAPSISTSPASLRHYASYQVRHGQRVVLLNRRAAYKGKTKGVRLSSIRPLKQSTGVSTEGIDYIIVHRDFVAERRRAQELSGEVSRTPLVGTQTERELAKKAEKLIEEFDADDTYLLVVQTELVAVYALTPAAVTAYEAWNVERN